MTQPKPSEVWTPTGGQHPRDSFRVHDIKVFFSPVGGGLIGALPLSEFLAQFRPAPADMTPFYMEYFGFDESPWILGFTNGDRWNGWGKPLVEKSCLDAYLTLDPELGSFMENGDFRYNGDGGGDDGYVMVTPQEILWEGEKLLVYDLGGLGLTWNRTELYTDDTEGYGPEDTLAICNAIIPEGWDRSKLKGEDEKA